LERPPRCVRFPDDFFPYFRNGILELWQTRAFAASVDFIYRRRNPCGEKRRRFAEISREFLMEARDMLHILRRRLGKAI